MHKIKKGRPKTFSKENANEIAMNVYWKEGMDNVSLNEICRKIGESKPSVYREYGGEEGLKVSALNLYLEKRVGTLSEYLFGTKGFLDNLQSAFDYLINSNSHLEDGNVYPCMYNKESWFPSSNLPIACQNIIKAKDQEIYSNLKKIILQAKEKKEIFIGLDIDIYTSFIHHQLKLIATLSNKKVSRKVLNGMVKLIIDPLKYSNI
jgi:AcrR family transcriptional regulator